MKRAASTFWNHESSDDEDLFAPNPSTLSSSSTEETETSQDITDREVVAYGFEPIYHHPLGLLLVSSPCYCGSFELQTTYSRIQLDTHSFKVLHRGDQPRFAVPPNLVSQPRWISRIQLDSWSELMGGIKEILSLISLNLALLLIEQKYVHIDSYLHPFLFLSWLHPIHFKYLQNTYAKAPLHISRFHALICKYEYRQMVWRTPIKSH